MKKRITIISLILSIFLLVGCNSNNQSEDKVEIASNYLNIKTSIGNYVFKTSSLEHQEGIINKHTYNVIIDAL